MDRQIFVTLSMSITSFTLGYLAGSIRRSMLRSMNSITSKLLHRLPRIASDCGSIPAPRITLAQPEIWTAQISPTTSVISDTEPERDVERAMILTDIEREPTLPNLADIQNAPIVVVGDDRPCMMDALLQMADEAIQPKPETIPGLIADLCMYDSDSDSISDGDSGSSFGYNYIADDDDDDDDDSDDDEEDEDGLNLEFYTSFPALDLTTRTRTIEEVLDELPEDDGPDVEYLTRIITPPRKPSSSSQWTSDVPVHRCSCGMRASYCLARPHRLEHPRVVALRLDWD